MRTYLSEDHRLHFPQGELSGGELVTPFERPSRVEFVLRRLRERGMEVLAPGPVDMGPVARVHDAGYLAFLESAWADWKAAGFAGEAIAAGMPTRRQAARIPKEIEGRLHYYCHASETAITAGTWEAARSAAASAQAAQRAVAGGERAAFALCRPPGHHATADQFGGYCFLNNAAVAAAMFRDGGARVAVLDVDFHAGNGTQDVFWRSGDVMHASVHGDPAHTYPWFSGFADEVGEGDGEGATVNVPLPPGTGYDRWSEALDHLIGRVRGFGAEALVVSLGTDAYKDDPISFFRLGSEDFADMGRRIGRMGLPTVFCMEGGYAIEQVGINAVNVLDGFEDA